MSSDLPVGQQSKGSFFTDAALNVRDARVRAQTAEDIAEELLEWARRQRAQAAAVWNPEGRRQLEHYATAYDNAAAIVRQRAGKAFPSSPAALPDVVGTPNHPEAQESRTGDERCSYCKTKDRDECPEEQV